MFIPGLIFIIFENLVDVYFTPGSHMRVHSNFSSVVLLHTTFCVLLHIFGRILDWMEYVASQLLT